MGLVGPAPSVRLPQMFRRPVTACSEGDRVGFCVTQLDPKLMERGIACAPGEQEQEVGSVKWQSLLSDIGRVLELRVPARANPLTDCCSLLVQRGRACSSCTCRSQRKCAFCAPWLPPLPCTVLRATLRRRPRR